MRSPAPPSPARAPRHIDCALPGAGAPRAADFRIGAAIRRFAAVS
jgi:hypothetical protein